MSYEDAREVLLGDDPVSNTAVSSLGMDRGCPAGIQQIVPESFLLQFGSALGEQPCTEVCAASPCARCAKLRSKQRRGKTLARQLGVAFLSCPPRRWCPC